MSVTSPFRHSGFGSPRAAMTSASASPGSACRSRNATRARQRARVAFLDLQADPGEALAEVIAARGEPKPLCLKGDVTDIPALQAAIARAGAELGPISVLVNNAANDQRHKVDDVSV